jgi:type IV secretory pathway VirJ component
MVPKAPVRLAAALMLAVALAATAVLLVGGYFESTPFKLTLGAGTVRPPIVAVYWSGDMGMRTGSGGGIVEALRARDIPVMTVSSPMLFGRARDRLFADEAVARSIAAALAQSGAAKVAVIGSSFGADMIASGLGHLAAGLRRRVASVVLIAPGTKIYFRADPSGLYYRGPSEVDPARIGPLLRGLAVTCISGAKEASSLCREPAMAWAKRVSMPDGHLMLFTRPRLHAEVVAAVEHPPSPLT